MVKIIAIFCLLSFTLTIDYSLSLISAEAYWIETGGNHHFSGLVFGIYDALTIFITPLIAIYIGKNGSYKKIFIIGLIINILGNILYALAYFFHSWIMIISGRGLAGLGATTLPMLMVYITDYMDRDSQISAVGYIKYVSAITRMIGPALGSIFTVTNHKEELWGKLFNMYTFVGWIPICFAILTIIVVGLFFQDISDNKKENIPISMRSDGDNGRSGICVIISELWTVWIIGFMSTFIYWLYMGNSFVIATHFFHVIDNEHELWRIYISGFGGFILAFVLFMLARNILSGIYGLVGSIILLILGTCLYLVCYNWMFYVAVGLSTFAYGVMIPSINIINNTIAKQNKQILGDKMALTISFLTIIQSLARFIGPAMIITFIVGDNSAECNFTNSDNYITDGCKIHAYYIMGGGYIGISAISMVVATIWNSQR
jgi:MFS family permease